MRILSRELLGDVEAYVRRKGKKGCTSSEIPFLYDKKALRYLKELKTRRVLIARPVGNGFLFIHRDCFSPSELEREWGVRP